MVCFVRFMSLGFGLLGHRNIPPKPTYSNNSSSGLSYLTNLVKGLNTPTRCQGAGRAQGLDGATDSLAKA